jgi:putative FmdB family regulatory protein
MPTYDYVCDACDHKFELFQGIKDAVKKKCPECGKSKLRRLFGTGAAIVFKGSGFYQTDYRSESYKKGEQAEKSKTSEGKSDGKSGGDSSGGSASSSGSSSGGSSGGESKSAASGNGQSTGSSGGKQESKSRKK